jgi:hypothetical protein
MWRFTSRPLGGADKGETLRITILKAHPQSQPDGAVWRLSVRCPIHIEGMVWRFSHITGDSPTMRNVRCVSRQFLQDEVWLASFHSYLIMRSTCGSFLAHNSMLLPKMERGTTAAHFRQVGAAALVLRGRFPPQSHMSVLLEADFFPPSPCYPMSRDHVHSGGALRSKLRLCRQLQI